MQKSDNSCATRTSRPSISTGASPHTHTTLQALSRLNSRHYAAAI